MVLTSVLFGLAFAFGIGVADLVSAILTRRLGVLRTVFLIQAIGVVGMAAFALATDALSGVSPRHWLLMAGMTALVTAFYLGFFKALQLGPVALVGPIVAAHSVVVLLLAMVFLGDEVTRWQLAAAGATVVGVALASMDFRALRSGRSIIGLGVALAIAVCIGAGFWQFGIAAISRELGWFAPVFVTRLMLVAVLIPIVAFLRQRPWRGLDTRLSLAILAVAAVESLALFAYTRGSEIGNVAIVAAASTAYPIIPVVGGIVWLRERLSAIQFAGLFIVILGLLGLTLLP